MNIDAFQSATAHTDAHVRVLWGAEARARLDEKEFLSEWANLAAACPWITPFQQPEFCTTWYREYADCAEPLVIEQRTQDEGLSGLFLLATMGGRLVVAGAQQAEYQAWIARPDNAVSFGTQAISTLAQKLPGHELRLRYVPPGCPIVEVAALDSLRGRAVVLEHDRPLWRLREPELNESLRKKGNKSRWNRLKRHGDLRLEVVRDSQQLESVLDQLIAQYDFRQGATQGVCPFADDVRKRPFHVALAHEAPDLLHLSALMVDDIVLAAHIGFRGNATMHLAIVSHSPLHSANSPGKLHLLQLGRELIGEGIDSFDLTPGGDSWKERFANDHDQVHEFVLHRSAQKVRWQNMGNMVAGCAKTILLKVGTSPHGIRRVVSEFRARVEATRDRREVHSLRLPITDPSIEKSEHVRCNHIEHLIRLRATVGSRHWRQMFECALEQLEAGASLYTVEHGGRIDGLLYTTASSSAQDVMTLRAVVHCPPGAAVVDLLRASNDSGDTCRDILLQHVLAVAQNDENVDQVLIVGAQKDEANRRVLKRVRVAPDS